MGESETVIVLVSYSSYNYQAQNVTLWSFSVFICLVDRERNETAESIDLKGSNNVTRYKITPIRPRKSQSLTTKARELRVG